ncbi:MAG: hypothetical protein ACRD30_10225 [Bryobacteraceae bacterium]
MIELGLTIAITASSVLLFAYWFRYTCLLILSAKTARDYAGAVAIANQLGFREVQARLQQPVFAELQVLKESLDRDYQVLTYLLQHAANPANASTIENRMLKIDYRMMRVWYSVSGRFSPTAARRALNEMANVVAHFANTMGERAAAAA